MTKGNPNPEQPCVFPFMDHEGKEQKECTIHQGKYWCGLAFNYSSSSWGWCDEDKCAATTAPPSTTGPPTSAATTSVPATTTPQQLCANPNGLYSHPTDCQKYYQCVHGTPNEHTCGTGLQWNQAAAYCDWAANVQCTVGTTAAPPSTTGPPTTAATTSVPVATTTSPIDVCGTLCGGNSSEPLTQDIKALRDSSTCTLDNARVEAITPGAATNPQNVRHVEAICPDSKFNYFFPAKNEAYTYTNFLRAIGKYPAICKTADNCPKILAGMFAHFQKETAGLVHLEEINKGNNYCGYSSAWVKAAYPCAPGQKYFGRGAMQLSWNYNYGPFSKAMFGDAKILLEKPELVATTWLNFASSMWFMVTPQPPKPSMLQIVNGEWTPNAAEKAANLLPGFGATIMVINGGIECGSLTTQAFYRIRYYKDFAAWLGVDTAGEKLDCADSRPFPAAGSANTLPLYWNPDDQCRAVKWQTAYSALVEGDYNDCKGLPVQCTVGPTTAPPSTTGPPTTAATTSVPVATTTSPIAVCGTLCGGNSSEPLTQDIKALRDLSTCTLDNARVEAITPGAATNPQNVKHVEAIFPDSKFNDFFPKKNEAYTYTNFLRAIGKYPAICKTAASCPKILAGMFAHFQQETAGLIHLEQIYQYYHYCSFSSALKAAYPCAPGQKYFGRGAKQLSWNYNYGAFSKAMFGDVKILLEKPELVATTWLNFASSMWFYVTPQPPKPSMLQVVDGTWSPNAVDTAANLTPGFGATTMIINGVLECGGSPSNPTGASNRATYYQDFAGRLGVDITGEKLTCSDSQPFSDTGSAGGLTLYWDPPTCNLVKWQTAYSALVEGDYNDCKGLPAATCGGAVTVTNAAPTAAPVTTVSSGNMWRDDGRCGPGHLLPNGTQGQCDPHGDANEVGPCCSSAGWCGNSDAHCKCNGCEDFRPKQTPDTCTGHVPATPVVVTSKPYDMWFPATSLFTLEEDAYTSQLFHNTSTGTYNIVVLRNYFLTPNGYRGDAFTLDLGSCATITGIRLKNTHHAHRKNRATKKFALHGAMSSNGPWTKLMEQSLEDARQQASPPVQKFQLAQEAEVRFIKFEMLDYWGLGGGLQYFAPFTAGGCEACATSSPVCGKDGQTYDCRACATVSGQEVAYGGQCKDNCTVTATRRRRQATGGEGRSDRVKRSQNGAYYACDFSTSSSQCIFTTTAETPASWGGLVEHSLACSPCGAVHGGQVCALQSSNGTELILSPKPWTNGDEIVATGLQTTGDDWIYALIFELVAPLRNLMMFHPGEATAERWAELTQAFVACGVKAEDEAGDHGTAFSVDNIYSKLTNPNGVDIHHNVLQFLEEGAIDLVCLATSLSMTRCDTIRAKWSVISGTRCNCWVPAYEAMYGVKPSLDTELATCSGIHNI